MDKIEKERKFLLRKLPQKLQWEKILTIHQLYVDGYRYRSTNQKAIPGEVRFERIKKVKMATGVNKEVDIQEITGEEFFNASQTTVSVPYIAKDRHIISYKDKTFEVDVFAYQTLVILEVEDVDMEDVIDFPPEIQKEIIMEVTGIEAFDNFNLAKK